jgi:hypothetical protein
MLAAPAIVPRSRPALALPGSGATEMCSRNLRATTMLTPGLALARQEAKEGHRRHAERSDAIGRRVLRSACRTPEHAAPSITRSAERPSSRRT